MRKIRCANGQIIKSPMINVNKTNTSIRHGVGTQPISSEESPDHNDELEDIESPQIKSPTKLIKSPTGSIMSKEKRRNKEGKRSALLKENQLYPRKSEHCPN
jgi:hypothetical protein